MSISVNSGSPGPVKPAAHSYLSQSPQINQSIVQGFVLRESHRRAAKACSLTVAVHTEVRGVQAEVSRVILTPVLVQRAGDALGDRVSIVAYRNPEETFHSDK